MVSRKKLKGVLSGFLGTFTSRYSEYRGYWLFGFLVEDSCQLEFDLLSEVESTSSPASLARRLAHVKFLDQLHKHHFPRSSIREARLTIERSSDKVELVVGDHLRCGHKVHFRVVALADNGRHFQQDVTAFVAPHDESMEHRSGRTPA